MVPGHAMTEKQLEELFILIWAEDRPADLGMAELTLSCRLARIRRWRGLSAAPLQIVRPESELNLAEAFCQDAQSLLQGS
jgi:hypothetical protein